MLSDRRFHVYIMASRSRVLYTGCTSDLIRRVYQHKNSRSAVAREREIKRWRREKKLKLIEAANPGWLDLARDWFRDISAQDPSLRSG